MGTQMYMHRIEDAIAAANGRRRTRILSAASVPQVIREALRDGIGGTTGGSVANCYGYPARTTRVWAVRTSRGDVAVRCETAPANKVSDCPGGRRAEAKLRAHADAHPEQYVIIPAATARRLVRDASAAGWGKCPVDGDVVVSVSDSLNTGNCATETARVRDALGGHEDVSASTLWSYCVSHEPPTLRPFVVRAMRHAAAMAKARPLPPLRGTGAARDSTAADAAEME